MKENLGRITEKNNEIEKASAEIEREILNLKDKTS